MLMVLTAFITSILTAMYVVNLGENNQQLSTGNSSTSSISTTNNNSTQSDGYVKQTSLENYSDTSVYAATRFTC